METETRTRIPAAAAEAGVRLMRLGAERDELEARIRAGVAEVRAAGGSWTTVAAALGTTRQAAQQRYGA